MESLYSFNRKIDPARAEKKQGIKSLATFFNTSKGYSPFSHKLQTTIIDALNSKCNNKEVF